MKLAAGLYLNEDNGQTFEIVDCSYGSVYVRMPDFFYSRTVHADEALDDIINLVFEGKITYIGEV